MTFSVSVSSPLLLIRSYRIEFYFFRICRSYAFRALSTLLRGKLGALPPGPAALLPRTRPSSNGISGRYGHGFYGNVHGNGYGNGCGNGYDNGYVTVEISHKRMRVRRVLFEIFGRRSTLISTSQIGSLRIRRWFTRYCRGSRPHQFLAGAWAPPCR